MNDLKKFKENCFDFSDISWDVILEICGKFYLIVLSDDVSIVDFFCYNNLFVFFSKNKI